MTCPPLVMPDGSEIRCQLSLPHGIHWAVDPDGITRRWPTAFKHPSGVDLEFPRSPRPPGLQLRPVE